MEGWNKLIIPIIGIAVSIICLATILVPVINDQSTSLGDSVTKSNNYYGAYYKDAEPTDVLTFSDGIYTYNGKVIDNAVYRGALYSDGGFIYIIYPTELIGAYAVLKENNEIINFYTGWSFTVTFDDGVCYINGIKEGETPITKSFDYTWCTVLSDETAAAYATIADVNYVDAYTTDAKKQVICSGWYSSGENDTFYSYRDGKLYTGSYAGSISYELTKVDGTTDIYKTIAKITVGDETFTPYLILVPLTVTGHATSGGAYNILFTIPVMVILVILMAAASMIMRNRE